MIERDVIDRINEYGKKWLEYMNSVDVTTIQICPNGHRLTAYIAPLVAMVIVICCPQDDCDYYDYNTFKVPVGTRLAIKVRRH